MAKKYNQKRAKTVKPDWTKIWIGAVAVFLILAMLLGVIGWRTSGFKDWTFGFGTKGELTEGSDNPPDVPNTDDNGGATVNPPDEDYEGATIIGSDENGIQLLCAELPRAAYAANGVSEQAENAYTLTVQVIPDYASDKSVNWTVAWQNSQSVWAKGKNVTDYVTNTPTADGALTAVCVCLQDFGEPVVITASSRSNPEVFGTCVVHYYQRVKSCDFEIYYDGNKVTPNIENGVYKVDYTGAENEYTVEIKPVYSNYTLADTYTTTIDGRLSSTFGYTAGEQLTTLKLPAGMSGGDPELSENALNWCQYVETSVFSYTYSNAYIEAISIGRNLCLGNDVFAHGNKLTPQYKLTDEEKLHPRCAYYISLLSDSNNFSSETAFNQTKSKYNSYQPAAYNYCGAQIKSYNDFVYAVKECNEENVGVIQYTVTISGEHSNYEVILNLGYNDEFKITVSDINMSDTELAF